MRTTKRSAGALLHERPSAGGAVWPALIAGRYAAMFFGLWAAVGTGVGVGRDALVPSRQVIYQPTGAARRVTVAPLLASNRRGLAVSFGFC